MFNDLMYTRLLVVALPALVSVTRALRLPVSSLEIQLPSSSTNLTINHDPTMTQPANSTSNPLTFLGVYCYHLLPDTVDIQMCQTAFAALYRGGHVHDKIKMYNGWFYKMQHEPCTIKIANTSEKERHDRVSISMAEIVRYATEVLEECRHPGSGGANTFEGNWQVVVTRNPIKDPIPRNDLDEQ